MKVSFIIPSLTLDKEQGGHKSRVYRLYGHFYSCTDMCYISPFCFFVLFVPLIMLRIEDREMNS